MNTDNDKKVDLLFEDLTYKIIGAAIEAHKVLGPGYLESVYEDVTSWMFYVSTQEPEVRIQESELACVYAQAGENRATILKRISGSRVPKLQEQSSDYNASL